VEQGQAGVVPQMDMRRFDLPLFLITYPEHSPVFRRVERPCAPFHRGFSRIAVLRGQPSGVKQGQASVEPQMDMRRSEFPFILITSPEHSPVFRRVERQVS
jgi:hypothetical protein